MANPDTNSGNIVDITSLLIKRRQAPLFDENDMILFCDPGEEGFSEHDVEAIRLNEEAARSIVEF